MLELETACAAYPTQADLWRKGSGVPPSRSRCSVLVRLLRRLDVNDRFPGLLPRRPRFWVSSQGAPDDRARTRKPGRSGVRVRPLPRQQVFQLGHQLGGAGNDVAGFQDVAAAVKLPHHAAGFLHQHDARGA